MEVVIVVAAIVVCAISGLLEVAAINIGIRIRNAKEQRLIRKERERFDG